MNYIIVNDLHVGNLIKEKLSQRNVSISEFAKMLYMDESNLYKTLKKKHINTELLARISELLNYNFFVDFQNQMEKNKCLLLIQMEKEQVNCLSLPKGAKILSKTLY